LKLSTNYSGCYNMMHGVDKQSVNPHAYGYVWLPSYIIPTRVRALLGVVDGLGNYEEGKPLALPDNLTASIPKALLLDLAKP
jgi:hypothetical protein